MGAYTYGSREPNRHNEAQQLVSYSLRLCRTIEDHWGTALCLHHLGHIAFNMGNYDKSETYTQQSLDLCHKIGDQDGIANAYNTLGQVAGALGNYPAAKDYYQRCLEIRQEFGNRKLIAECLDALGYINYLLGNDETAENCYRQSLKMSRAVNDIHGVAWSLHNLGDIARFRGQYEQARQFYQDSIETHAKINRLHWGSMVALEKLARTLSKLGQHDVAQEYFVQAFSLAVEMKRYREAVDALFGLAQLLIATGHQEQATLFLSVTLHHHATARQVRDRAQEMINTLTPTFPANYTPKITLADIAAQLG